MENSEFQELVNKSRNQTLSEIIRCEAIQKLAGTKDRRLYDILLDLVRNEDGYVKLDSIISTALTSDSRFFFPLINLYNNTESIQERERILMSLGELRDPRALEFLQRLITSDDDLIREIASTAYSKVISGLNNTFLYRFIGSEDTRKQAENSKGYIEVRDINGLIKNRDIIFDPSNKRLPQTYVVLIPNNFRVGGYSHEHVEVASGNDVLAAGEVVFDMTTLQIDYINNRSNGYYPHPESFKHVLISLENLDILKQKQFSELFPRNGFLDDDILRNFPFYRQD